jgi:hypothetical protein
VAVTTAGSNATHIRLMRMTSLDTVLASVGTADPVPTPLRRPDVTGGVHWALTGNIWNTNYPARRIAFLSEIFSGNVPPFDAQFQFTDSCVYGVLPSLTQR